MARRAAMLFLLPLSVLPSFGRLSAQVGYDPAHSPYQDMQKGMGPVAFVGYLAGDRGTVGVGPSNGATFGVRWDVNLGGTVAFLVSFADARTNRFIVDPTQDSTVRKSGPVSNPVVLADVGLEVLLTGGKTYHHLAPYLQTALGFAFGSSTARDTSGYDFGTKFTLAPGAGIRWYPSRRICVQTDLRLLFWKLKYPLSYKVPASDSSRVLPVSAPDGDWTTHPWLTLGVGWTF
ncbi:MAG TPA: hypothetical protein VFK78_08165 [Gemmatimonadales bacterium]|nr:hypothetical protein [Gemmatimonadales bacterium]